MYEVIPKAKFLGTRSLWMGQDQICVYPRNTSTDCYIAHRHLGKLNWERILVALLITIFYPVLLLVSKESICVTSWIPWHFRLWWNCDLHTRTLYVWSHEFMLKLHKKTPTMYKKLVLALFVQYVIQKCNTLHVFFLRISDDGEIVNFISQKLP